MGMTVQELIERLDDYAGTLLMIGPKDLPDLAQLHTGFEGISKGAVELQIPRASVEALAVCDVIESVIKEEESEPDVALEGIGKSISVIQALLRGQNVPEPADAQASADAPGDDAQGESVQAKAPQLEPIVVDPSLLGDFIGESNEHLESANVSLLTLETNPDDEDSINSVFRAFHTIKGVSGFLGLALIQKLAHESENLLDQARKGKIALTGSAIDVVFDSVDGLKSLIEAIQESNGVEPPADDAMNALIQSIQDVLAGKEPAGGDEDAELPPARLGDILVQRGTVTPGELENALQEQSKDEEHPKLGEVLVRKQKVPGKEVSHALRTQKQLSGEPSAGAVRETVKVDAERLDRLVDMIGELVITESMVEQLALAQGDGNQRLAQALGQLDKITRELQEMGTTLRMIPVRSTFQKMARLVRDLSKKSGKKVSLKLTGEDTELDKMVVDKIGDPLIHMVRNAVDHGLEASGDDRIKAGKSAEGHVELRAFHRGGNIYIEIEDDGRGLDRDAILAKARDRGLIAPDAQLSDREIFNLIFNAGLSTAKKITDVSGRGVGMDVVKKNIEALRGQVDIQSERGKGSVFSIRLPLTLAIIDGMVLRVGGERYVIPTLSIHTSLRPSAEMLATVQGGGRMLRLKNELIPVFNLDKLFSVADAGGDSEDQLVVIVENDGKKAGITADELLGQQQIVIKPLGAALHDTPGIAGGAIMPDGVVSLILDVTGLIKLAHTEPKAPTAL